MKRRIATTASLALLLIPLAAAPSSSVSKDLYEQAVEALAAGRHWYAKRLLSKIARDAATRPAVALLAAEADAGRGAWSEVARRLNGEEWLDALEFGRGRELLARAQLELGRYDDALGNYDAFLAYSVTREPRSLALIGRARVLAALERPAQATAAYAQAMELLPELEPWLAIKAAELLASTGDTVLVHDFLANADDVPRWRRLLARADAHEAAGDARRAVSMLLQSANSSRDRRRAARLRSRAARAQLALADTVGAIRTLRTAIRAGGQDGRKAADLLVLLPGLSTNDHLQLARAYERSAHRTHAVSQYREYMARARLSKAQRANLQLKMGVLLFNARHHTAAIDELEAFLETRPRRALAARAEYYIARATYRRGLEGAGRARLRGVADEYPGTGSAINALFLLADVYEGAGRLAEARDVYDELAKKYPWTQTAGRARFRLGILAYIDGDHAAAREHFDRCRQAFRRADLRTQATYWAARARLAEGGAERRAEASRLFKVTHARDPFGYYGLLAAERAGIDPWAGLAAGPEPAPIDSLSAERFASIRLLRRAGLTEETDALLEMILASAPSKPDALLGLADALAEHGFGRDAVRLGWTAQARSREWSESLLRAIYPLTYSEILLAEARDHRVDPHLVAAVVRQESAFEAGAVSPAGARGLMQIMPPTGRWWAARLGVRDYQESLLFHPETNVHFGTAYLADLERRFDLNLALSAYNAGPNRARRWRVRPSYRVDPELFAERIPFRETRGYVRGVQTQLRIYRHLYSDFGTVSASD